MSVQFTAGDYYAATLGTAPITDFPITIAGWGFFSNMVGGNYQFFSYSQFAASNQFIAFYEANGSGEWQVNHRSAANNVLSSGTNITANGWRHFAWRAGSTTDREIYYNGASTGTDTDSDAFISSPDRVGIGCLGSSSAYEVGANGGDDYRGAHWAIWAASLTADEIAALARGVHPLRIRPQSIVGYWPLYSTAYLLDRSPSGLALDVTGDTPTTGVDNPPVEPFSRRFWGQMPFPGAAGISQAIGLVTETDLSQAMAKAKARAFSFASETDLAQAISAVRVYPMGLPTETDLSQAMTASFGHIMGLVTELDVAQAMSTAKARAFGLVTETDAALIMAVLRAYAMGLVTETDLAQAMTSLKERELLRAVETEWGQPFTSLKAKAFGQATETDLAQSMSASFATIMQLVTELDAALAMTSQKAKAFGLASEADAALALAAGGGGGSGPVNLLLLGCG